MFLKITEKVTKYLGNFCTKICRKELLNLVTLVYGCRLQVPRTAVEVSLASGSPLS